MVQKILHGLASERLHWLLRAAVTRKIISVFSVALVLLFCLLCVPLPSVFSQSLTHSLAISLSLTFTDALCFVRYFALLKIQARLVDLLCFLLQWNHVLFWVPKMIIKRLDRFRSSVS